MQFDVLYQELASGAAMIQALLMGVTAEQARSRPAPEAWSMLEVLCHLADEEREDFRAHADYILHHADQPWPEIDPQGWVKARRYNERELDAALEDFLAERLRSLAWLKALPAVDWNTMITVTFGPSNESFSLSAGDMLASWVAHDNLHMRQLVELRRERLVRLAEPCRVEYAGRW